MPKAKTSRLLRFFSISRSFLVVMIPKSAEYYGDVLGRTFDRYSGEPTRRVIARSPQRAQGSEHHLTGMTA